MIHVNSLLELSGSRTTRTVSNLRELIRVHRLDVVFLLETKNTKNVMERIHRRATMTNSYYVNLVGLSSGLSLWWADSIEFQILAGQLHLIKALISISQTNIQWKAFFIYAPNNKEQRMVLWDNILQFMHSLCKLVIFIGDFNVVKKSADKVGGNPNIFNNIEELQNFISGANLLDVPFKGIR